MTGTKIHLNHLTYLDEQKINYRHMQIATIAGIGFFTDAYDIFIIAVVTSILEPIWKLSLLQISLLNAASLISAPLGAIFFGFYADKLGRKKFYGFEIAILFFGAILSGISNGFIWLFFSRLLLGFGIGGDYPSSAVVASEYANRKNRGFIVLFVFCMQALGLLLGPLCAAFFLAVHIPEEYVWRILLLIGAIPALFVFHYRRKISETPRYIFNQKNSLIYIEETTYLFLKKHSIFSWRWFKPLLGTCGAWFLFDIAFYGNAVSSILIINNLHPNSSLLQYILLTAMIFIVFAFPGYILSAIFVDKIGRRYLQSIGFFIMSICYAAMGLIPHIEHHLMIFVTLFGLSFFFINFGPNATTFLIPSEIFPTEIRAQAHGISAALGKIGALIGVCLLPPILSSYHFSCTMWFVAIISILGAVITQFLPEMSGQSLEMTE